MENVTPSDRATLRRLAIKYLLWEDTEEALGDLPGLAVRLMNDVEEIDEMQDVRRIFGDDFLRQVLNDSPAILFSPGAWGWWHNWLGLKARPQPRRMLGIKPRIIRDY
jgi:hypothetical protein